MSDALVEYPKPAEGAGFIPDPLIKYCYEDYAGWKLPPGLRYELYYGTAYLMAAPSMAHQAIANNLTGMFYSLLKGKKCRSYPAPVDVRLFPRENKSDGTVVQPDLIVICDGAKIGEQSCNGAPDLVIEILSPSTSRNDLLYKLNLYLEAGVREYWIVDPERKIVQQYVLKEGEYVYRSHTGGPIPVHIFEGAFPIEHGAIFENAG